MIAAQLHQQFISGLLEAKGVSDPAAMELHRAELARLWMQASKLLQSHQDTLDAMALARLQHITHRKVLDHLVLQRGDHVVVPTY